MKSDEHSIQCTVVQLLRLGAPDHVVFMAIPNGEYRSKRTAGRLKAQGVAAGAPDLLIIVRGVAHGLELKTIKGRQSPAQRLMERRWEAAGGRYEVARGIDEAIAVLTHWGALSGRVQALAGKAAA